MTLYSFRDLTGVYFHPLTGSFILGGGNIGLGMLTFTMTTDRTVIDMASDGTPMMSYIAGDNATADVEMQQTSALHDFFLNTFNLCKLAADNGDVSLWGAGTLAARNLVDGSMHTATGVAFGKVPPKVYGGSGAKLTWNLHCAKLVNE